MSETTAPRPVSFASLVQQFFTEYLVTQRALSPRTIASYRDAMLLFLDFARKRLGKMPTAFNLADIEPDLILAFLDHLEQERHNSVRSRNLRLTALRAFLKFAARRDVSSFYVIERALGVPMKRFERPILGFLSREEMVVVLGQPGDTWTSQRDHLLQSGVAFSVIALWLGHESTETTHQYVEANLAMKAHPLVWFNCCSPAGPPPCPRRS